GILRLIEGQSSSPDAERWTQVCSGSGSCIPRCQYGVNPRFMLALARLSLQKRATAEEQHAKGATAFAAMGRGVRVLSRMQLPADMLARFRTATTAKPDGVRYPGS